MKTGSGFKNIAIILLIALFCQAWGFFVHRSIHQLGIYQLPEKPGNFFFAHKEYLVRESVRPDQRRNEDSTEDKKHYIDLEPFGEFAAKRLPRNPAEGWSQYKDSLLLYGYLPYQVDLMKNRLTAAMRSMNADSILFYAADIGHYISDAHVPLHTTLNYDGQLSDQKGIHALWESLSPEADLKNYRLRSSRKARYLKDPQERIWQIIGEAHELLPEMLEAERRVSQRFTDSTKFRMVKRGDRSLRYYTKEFITAYALEMRSMINGQLVKSAESVADFWFTCWVDAGKPDLNRLVDPSRTRKKERKLAIKAYRNERLVSDSLLIALKSLRAPE